MNILKKIQFAYKVLSTKSVSITDPTAFKAAFTEYLQGTSSQENTGYISACADVYGKYGAKIKRRVFDEELEEEVKSHPILDLMKKPNWFQTSWEINYRRWIDYCFYGNSYLMKLRDGLGVPRSVIQLHPNRVKTKPYGVERIDSYVYTALGGDLEIPASEIIHFRYPDLNNYILGSPIISKILDLKEVEKMQLQYMKQFYKQGGFLGAVFTTQQKMGADSFKRAKDELQKNYSGSVDNAFKIALFEQGLEPVPTAYSPKDMDMTDQRTLNKTEILAAFQMNKFLLGESELIQRGNADTVLYAFAQGVVDPIASYEDEVYTNQLAKLDFAIDGDSPYCVKHDTVAQKDIEQTMAYYKNAGGGDGNAMWLEPNEIRHLEGYEPNDALNALALQPKQNPINQPAN